MKARRAHVRILLGVLLAAAAGAALDPSAHLVARDPEDGAFEVERLPGFDGELPARHRAGYVTVSPDDGRRLYYYLAGSESPTAESDPLIVWLTGGPGCSSLDAFTYEHGPFSFHLPDDANGGARRAAGGVELSVNPHSWSKAAHVLYVDSPAGTGMSYSTGPESVYRTDDDQTADDLLALVLGVLRDAPDMRHRDVVVAGESYGGVYVPMLADRILRHNERLAAEGSEAAAREGAPARAGQQRRRRLQRAEDGGESSSDGGGSGSGSGGSGSSIGGSSGSSGDSNSGTVAHPRRMIRLAGYVIGNGVTDDEVDGNSQVPFAFGAGLLDDATLAFVASACGGAYWNASRGGKCWEALDLVDSAIGDVNPYDLLSPCYFPHRLSALSTAAGEEAPPASRRAWPWAARFERGASVRNWWGAFGAAAGGGGGVDGGGAFESGSGGASGGAGGAAGAGGAQPGPRLGHTVPCADRRAALAYYNDGSVRRAIHAAPKNVAGRWEPCSDVLDYTHTAGSMIPLHRRLLAAGLRALVFSGTQDYVVPFTGTRDWTAALGLPIEFPWRPWKLGGQVAGHAVRYRSEGQGPLTFATVMGAGHMVPAGRPEAALALLQDWLDRRL
ncbi:serine carboxypeptidase-like protein [Raphidocelis subcapitata]|uniref:Carboxypeptidase n=1 Tax=Raphidocelis subcapitata TaxID=307507 RepID=A0A2V0NUP1_9CHLO|nr:serine carboxypeptidase-like protein [Raphidocelis subcapitata]|eukprot:GBF90392.1 serine carboxypeptidase-like protein [Raphidocelis subcapitata]